LFYLKGLKKNDVKFAYICPFPRCLVKKQDTSFQEEWMGAIIAVDGLSPRKSPVIEVNTQYSFSSDL
jgi:hypothetical protein